MLRRYIYTAAIILVLSLLSGLFVLVVSARSQEVIRYEVYVVKSGDTLWSIAKKYATKNIDIRRYIYDIMRENGMETPALMPGQVLHIPVGER